MQRTIPTTGSRVTNRRRARGRILTAATLFLGSLVELGCAGPESTLSREEVLDLFESSPAEVVSQPAVEPVRPSEQNPEPNVRIAPAVIEPQEILELFEPTPVAAVSPPPASPPVDEPVQPREQSLEPSLRFAPTAIEPQEEVSAPPEEIPVQPQPIQPQTIQPQPIQPPQLRPQPIQSQPAPLPLPMPLQRSAPPLLPVIPKPVAEPETLPPANAGQASGDLNQDIRPIGALGIDIRPPEAFDQAGTPVALPPNYATAALAQQPAYTRGTNIDYSRVAYAGGPGLEFCYQPLFFEEVNVERYGRSLGPLQPLLSMAEFYGRMPALPYMMVARRARTCSYHPHWTLPGYKAPFEYPSPIIRADAAFAETAFIYGMILLIP